MKEIIHHEGSFGQGLENMIKGISSEQFIGKRNAASLKITRVRVAIKKAFLEKTVF